MTQISRRFHGGAEFLPAPPQEELRDAAVLALFDVGEEVAAQTIIAARPAGMGEGSARSSIRRLVNAGSLVTNNLPATSPKLRYSLPAQPQGG